MPLQVSAIRKDRSGKNPKKYASLLILRGYQPVTLMSVRVASRCNELPEPAEIHSYECLCEHPKAGDDPG